MNIRKWLDLFSKDLALKYNSEQTRKIYYSGVKGFLNRFSDYPEPKSIPNKDIKEWLLEADTINTRKHRLCSVKCFYCVTVGMTKKISSIPYPKKVKSLPIVVDKDYIISRINKIKNLKHKAIIQLAFSTGMRVSEVINLRIKDIDSYRMLIHIKNAKGRKDRIVKLTESTLYLLREYYREFKPVGFMFNGQIGNKYSSGSCNKIVKKYLGQSFHFHLLRHSSLTSMIDCGTDVSIVQKVAGHNSLNTTMGYLHVSQKAISQVNAPI